MQRTQAAYDRAKRRRQERKQQTYQDWLDQINWKACGWCGMKWNPTKHGLKYGRWLGKLICPTCSDFPYRILHALVELDIVKLKKKMPELPARKGPFENVINTKLEKGIRGFGWPTPNPPRYRRCRYCGQLQCINNSPPEYVKIHYNTYKGKTICIRCQKLLKRFLPILIREKYIKLKDAA